MISDGSNGDDNGGPENASDDTGGRRASPPPLPSNTTPHQPNTPEPPEAPAGGVPSTPEPPAPEKPSVPGELAGEAKPPPTTPKRPPAGRIRRQEPGVTQPRPPTVAEARARDKARRQQEEMAQAAIAAADKRKKRNRRLIGGGAVVGLVGVVALGYYAFKSDDVTAQCTRIENGEEIVVEDRFCSGSPNASGIFILAGTQYRYHYGGTGAIGQPPAGGTTVKPKGANITTQSGTTVQRGGLGSKVGGSSGS